MKYNNIPNVVNFEAIGPGEYFWYNNNVHICISNNSDTSGQYECLTFTEHKAEPFRPKINQFTQVLRVNIEHMSLK